LQHNHHYPTELHFRQLCVSEKCTGKLPTNPVLVFAPAVRKLWVCPGKGTDCWRQCKSSTEEQREFSMLPQKRHV